MDQSVINAVLEVARSEHKDAASLLAVVDVESAGVAMWWIHSKPMPPIRFEGHYFYQRLLPKQRELAIRQGLASPKVGGVKNPSSGEARYELLERAKKINEQAALESCSWGLGQVMGAHWDKLGFSSVHELVKKSQSGISGQIDLMTDYIDLFGLGDELARRDWAEFARLYNGRRYKENKYDTKLAEAYKRYHRMLKLVDGEPNAPVAIQTVSNRMIQEKLKVIGLYDGEIDGIIGSKSKEAIRKFQQENGLIADGIAGPLTGEALDRAIAARQSSSSRTAIKWAAGLIAGGAVSSKDIIDAVVSAKDAASSARGLVEQIGLTGGLATVIVAVVVVLVVSRMLAKVGPEPTA